MSVKFKDAQVGDTVTRLISSARVPMELKVTALTPDRIVCGAWEFDRATGVEEDEELGWGVKFGVTGSYLV